MMLTSDHVMIDVFTYGFDQIVIYPVHFQRFPLVTTFLPQENTLLLQLLLMVKVFLILFCCLTNNKNKQIVVAVI